MSASTEPAAKRRKIGEEKVALRGLSADQFFDKLSLFSGPQAIVCVGGEEVKLPKALLCYHSTYLRGALEGSFKESIEQKVHIDDFDMSTFKLIVQWIYQEAIKLQNDTADASNSAARNSPLILANVGDSEEVEARASESARFQSLAQHNLTQSLRFLQFADYLGLSGTFELVIDAMRAIVIKDFDCLIPTHVRLVMELPTSHRARKHIIDLLVPTYINHLLNDGSFGFENEIKEFDGFAAEMLRRTAKVFAKKTLTPSGDFKIRMRPHVYKNTVWNFGSFVITTTID